MIGCAALADGTKFRERKGQRSDDSREWMSPRAIGEIDARLIDLEATDANGGITAKESVSALRFGGFLAMDVSILSL